MLLHLRTAAAVVALTVFGSSTAQIAYGASNSSNATSNSTSLPIVDLGYELHQAILYNDTGRFYNFSNIRFGKSPTGSLRFRAPQPPDVNRAQVQTGSQGRICPQAQPFWETHVVPFIINYLYLGKTNFTPADFPNSNDTTALTIQDPRSTEDCLFLDVVVPKNIFDGAGKTRGAPVLVWFFGGGYVNGDKTSTGNPAGLLKRSQNNNNTGVIYVSFNYRLGAFGFLAGPTFAENGTPNAALYDQRLALKWVQDHIAKFGGDPKRVTVFGESAGGGSIMHQITAFGGVRPPFQQAIPQSPGFQPIISTVQQEQAFNAFLKLLNVSSIEQARGLSYQSLQTANIMQIGLQSGYGLFTYGPVVDGVFSTQLPGQALARGKFPKNLKVMVGHNADEGLLFTSPFISNDTVYRQELLNLLPTAAAFPSVIDYIADTLYPSEDYPDQIARASATIAESVFTCNTFYLDKAYKNQTYAYLYAVPPALHGQDAAYTYYNGPSPSVVNESIAFALQEYITHFAEYGYPSEAGVPFFPIYGSNATIEVLNANSIREAMDDTANYRCNWWQKAVYY